MFINKSLISKLSFLLVFLPILSIAENIPVTNKFIKKGSIIKQEDITELQVEKSANLNLIDDAQLLVESLAMKDINANLSISKNQIKPQNLVLRNSLIDLCYNSNAILLRTKAIALQNASYGSTVKLKAVDSKKNILGIIMGRNKVIIQS